MDSLHTCASFQGLACSYMHTFIYIVLDTAVTKVHPCGKINVIMTLGGEGVLVHDVYNCIVSRL